MILFGAIIGFLYLLILVILFIGNLKVPEFFSAEKNSKKTHFSIIIPFRNEAEHLPELLNSLEKINYPKDCFEVIFVDDASKDNSVKLIEKTLKKFNKIFLFTILKNERKSNSPKKDAITLAVSKVKYDWVVTTDADCVVPKNWLQVFHSFILKNQPNLIAAPVGLTNQKSLIGKYQVFDLLSLQTVTMGGFGMKIPLLCNGANLCYKKEVFNRVNGYEGNTHIASGDDVFLLEKINNKYPNKVAFLKSKEAIVITKSEDSWTKIIRQRIRWTSKTSKQNNWVSKGIGLVVFLCNFLLIIGAILSFLDTNYLSYFLVFWMLKLIIDFLFIIATASFFNNKISFFQFIIASLVYSFVTVFIVFRSFSGNYVWKDREFKK